MPATHKATVLCPVCKASHLPTSDTVRDGVFAATCEHCGHFFKFKATPDVKSTVTLTVNGTPYTVGTEYGPSATLLDFLRKSRVSMGTKLMCNEGGCGICVVEVKLFEPITEEKLSYAVNSCLIPLYVCDGWNITTVEGLGSQRKGLHPIQKALASHNGTQCGYCSPGQVMNMYALTKYKPKFTKREVEDSFDGIMCRCTGYRSILDGFKSLASDGVDGTTDIEDLDTKVCHKPGWSCPGSCQGNSSVARPIHMVFADSQWYKPTTADALIKLLKQQTGKTVKLVFGNTSQGVYPDMGTDQFEILIDIRGIRELYGIDFDPTIVLGANLSISELINIFDRVSAEKDLKYLKECAKHLSRVASTPVRNAGSWAGNIMIKHKHHDFPSDVFLILEVLKALILIGVDGDQINITDFLSADMAGKVILAFAFETLDENVNIKFYKVMPRSQNAHAYVNAGFRMKIDKTKNFTVLEQPVIVYGGISATFSHATKTEQYLNGKELGDPAVLQGALAILESEVVPDNNPVLSSPDYRKKLTYSLLYKYFLHVLGDQAASKYTTGATSVYLTRPLSSGQQTYDTHEVEYPVTEPLKKLESDVQVTGEAEYVDDMPDMPGQLYAAFVLSTQANAKIQNIDSTEALKVAGVVKVITATDIPGSNNFAFPGFPAEEEVLCSGQVLYAGQGVALVVAESQKIADAAAKLVQVTYTDIQPPILDLDDAIQQKSFFPKSADDVVVGDAAAAISQSPKSLTGSIKMGTQYHFHMETQNSNCIPTEDGMNVFTTTQWVDGAQNAISQVTGMLKSSVNVEVKRLGGAYGAKITRNWWVAAACGLAAYLTNRPVKLRMDLHSNMEMIGKRFPYRADYQAGYTLDGKLNGLIITYYSECGCSPNDDSVGFAFILADNAYYCPNWHLSGVSVKTNKSASTAARAPGSLPAIFITETIMEHIAKDLQKDPGTVKFLNLYQKGQMTPAKMKLDYCSISNLYTQLTTECQLSTRMQQIEAYNMFSRWKKKGLSVVPMKFGIGWDGAYYGVQVSVYNGDGSVAVAHSGIEMGQGINTKVAQVCAFELGIPINMVKIKASNSFSNANSINTGGSIGSENCCQGTIECCAQILTRMAPVKAKLADKSWKSVVKACYIAEVDLTARYWVAPQGDSSPFHYNSYGVTCTEVELDVLTGENRINRVDMLFDCGESINPAVDIGQIEGAFVMGLGYWLTELCKYDPNTGQLLTNSTWEYKPPTTKDIPVDFRINLLKNAPNPMGVLRSKACGEPPMCMSCSALFALKHAIEAARKEIGMDQFFPLDGPATVEQAQLACLVDPKQFLIK